MQKHSTREQWLTAAVAELRPLFISRSAPLPALIRVTCGFPSSKARTLDRCVGEHWSPAVSKDGHHELMISPVEDDPVKVFAVLIKCLCHAALHADGKDLHRGRFPSLIKSLWLGGKPTRPTVTPAFEINFADLIESLGDYPHAALNIGVERKTQSTRMLKASCPMCSYTIRLTDKWAKLGLPVCPVDSMPFTL